MNEDKQQTSGQGPESKGPPSATKHDPTDALKADIQTLLEENSDLRKTLQKAERKIENQKTALKGKETQIKNLKEKVKAGGEKKLTLHQH